MIEILNAAPVDSWLACNRTKQWQTLNVDNKKSSLLVSARRMQLLEGVVKIIPGLLMAYINKKVF